MLLLASGFPLAVAQTEGPEPEAPSIEKARDAFRDAIERIWIPKSRLSNGAHVRAAFRDVVADANQSTAQIQCDGNRAALGAIVGPDGWVLTKATRLNGVVTVRLHDGRELDARIAGVDREYDLAMLKLDAKDLPALDLADASEAIDGDWVATTGLGKDPVAVGVISVSPRRIPHRRGILGVSLADSESGAMVLNVFAGTGAERAGILVNDTVTAINGQPTRSRDELVTTVARYSPGDEIEVSLTRGDQRLVLRATLTGRVKNMYFSRSDYQNNMGTVLSQRRFGFPTALQHDSVLSASDCGGPLVDLEGRVVGFNIARAGRTESYAVPTSVVRELLFDLMSGAKAPAG